ncbi:hypothetical protein FB45DRAFT_1039381 [Roridomyces roridus]|uniref:Uncharacterized protein n=1 Tax=Roridomyces roridus TaxID=1738132 RepID=A0AAD7B2D1_9AGAR|nr:hypothetical protein FB45DRAFT_1039381 [Roridomyces roridus]
MADLRPLAVVPTGTVVRLTHLPDGRLNWLIPGVPRSLPVRRYGRFITIGRETMSRRRILVPWEGVLPQLQTPSQPQDWTFTTRHRMYAFNIQQGVWELTEVNGGVLTEAISGAPDHVLIVTFRLPVPPGLAIVALFIHSYLIHHPPTPTIPPVPSIPPASQFRADQLILEVDGDTIATWVGTHVRLEVTMGSHDGGIGREPALYT